MALGARFIAKRRQRRIELGSGGTIHMLVTGVVAMAAYYTQANLLFWAFGLMVGAFGVSVLLSWQMLRRLRVERVLPGHGVADEAMVIRYQLANRSWLPVFSLSVMETWGQRRRSWRRQGAVAGPTPMLKGRPLGWVLHVGPNQAIQAESTCWPLRRGVLRFERIVLSTGFPFGVLRKVVCFDQPGETLIYPHLYRVNRRLIHAVASQTPGGRKQRDRAGGMEDFFGLRPYRVGDSLKMIDWKRSAHTSELVSREMTRPSPPRMMVLLDLGQRPPHADDAPRRRGKPRSGVDREALLERAVSLTASLVCEAHFQGYQVGLAVRGAASQSFGIHHSLPHRTRMLESLARLDAAQPATDPDPPPTAPSVVVSLGEGDPTLGRDPRHGAAMLGAADMEQYVQPSERATRLLLGRHAPPPTRRDELRG